MKYRKSHFRYTRDQRNGTFYLLLLIVVCQIAYYFWVNKTGEQVRPDTVELVAKFNAERDSLLALQKKEKTFKVYKTNPNYISDFKGYQLGMSVDEIDRLLAFRESGKFVNTEKEFQKVTGVSDSLMRSIRPLLKFSNFSKKKKATVLVPIVKKDINNATIEDLQKVNGVGEVLSERIIKYRDKLQGFSEEGQLGEVYNLKPEVVQELWKNFEIQTIPKIELLNVNTASFKELLSIVYIDYELTKKILEYRDEVAEIQDLSELQKIDGFPIDRFDRIALYLCAN